MKYWKKRFWVEWSSVSDGSKYDKVVTREELENKLLDESIEILNVIVATTEA